MKKLVIPALLLGALQATGCIFVSDDDTEDTATINVSWTLVSDGAPAGCPAGANTAAVNAQRDGQGSPYVDLFDCSDLSGFADDLPLGTYTVWIDFTDGGSSLYAQSQAAEITLDTPGEQASASFEVDVDNGFFDVSWEIHSAGGGTGCASVAQNGVGVLSTLAGTVEGVDDKFTCAAGESPAIATTPALPIGDYTVVLSLLEPGTDASMGDSDAISTSIDYGNQFVDLGVVSITEGVFPN